MEKTLKVLECININEWYNKMRQEKKLDGLTVKTLWALRKNMKKIQDVVDSFNEFKEGLENDLKAEFFTEEKNYICFIIIIWFKFIKKILKY